MLFSSRFAPALVCWGPSRELQSFRINLLLCGLSMGCSFLQGTFTYSIEVLRGLQGDNLLNNGLLQGLQWNTCSGTWSTSSTSSSLFPQGSQGCFSYSPLTAKQGFALPHPDSPQVPP